MGGGSIPKSKSKSRKQVKDNSVDWSDDNNSDSKSSVDKLNKRFRLLLIIQVIIIALLVLNFVVSHFQIITEGPVINAGDGIELEYEDVGEGYNTYKVKVTLKNKGETTARVSVSGDVRISAMQSAEGEEVTAVLDNKYVEIGAGQSKTLNLGTFTEYENWHYVVKVHVGWNGGYFELTKLLIPQV